ncbi:hypothetical protein [Maribellus mangrovi]|uniref:hypothetical protein n=1 Tax=Maribellus mangrovi TaxID=3133146 RepID=UPI0030ED0C77
MEYTINKTTRNSIIFCSSLIILHVLITRLLFLFDTPTTIDRSEQLIRNVIYLIPFGYLMFVFHGYFKHYRLKVLQISIFLIFTMEVFLKSTLFKNMFESTIIKTIFLIASAIWIIATIFLIIFLFKSKIKKLPGITYIQMYAISIILIYILATPIPFYVQRENILKTQLLVGLTNVIPYVFTLIFALKLKIKNKTSS